MFCEQEAEAVLSPTSANLPDVGVKFACAYGSRFAERSETSQLDMLLVVDAKDVSEWHRLNLQRNSDHYAAWAQYLGPSWIEYVQNFNPSIYYNVNAPLQGLSRPDKVQFKYGIIATELLIDDLTNWSHLYAAGRLQKPVYELTRIKSAMDAASDPSYARLQQALRDNWRQAVAAALLDLPETFSDTELYTSIVSISYRGDLRMAVGENPHKISNIVRAPGNLGRFHSMYSSSIDTLSRSGFIRVTQRASSGEPIRFSQDLSKHSGLVEKHLPSKFQQVMKQVNRDGSLKASAAALRAAEVIVRRSSYKQTAKGFFTAGPFTSLAYAGRKLIKNIGGRLRLI